VRVDISQNCVRGNLNRNATRVSVRSEKDSKSCEKSDDVWRQDARGLILAASSAAAVSGSPIAPPVGARR